MVINFVIVSLFETFLFLSFEMNEWNNALNNANGLHLIILCDSCTLNIKLWNIIIRYNMKSFLLQCFPFFNCLLLDWLKIDKFFLDRNLMGLKPRQTQCWSFGGRIRHSWHLDGIVIHRSGYLIFNLWTSKRFGKWPIALVYRSSGIILWLWSKVKQKSCFPSSPDFYKDPPLFNFRQR